MSEPAGLAYLREVLALAAEDSAAEIIRRRSQFLRGEPSVIEAEAASEGECDLETLFRRRLKTLRQKFWTMPAEELSRQLEQLQQVKHPPTVTAARHFARVVPHREAFALLSWHPDANQKFVDAFKRVLVAPAAEASAVREQQLCWMRPEQNPSYARAQHAIHTTVRMIERDSGALFALERSWLTELLQFNPTEEQENESANQAVGCGMLVMGTGTIYLIYRLVWWNLFMTEQSEPDWDALPHDPLTFFALEGDFDPRDLKRSYNRLIRQFKPEKFPEEFQRIRAAYESLNNGIRYGLIDRHRPDPALRPSFDLQELIESVTQNASARHDSTAEAGAGNESPDELPECEIIRPEPVRLSVRDRLEQGSASQLYEQLRQQESKSAEEWVALALLADVVRSTRESFVDWLLLGLADHSGDWGLTSLLRDYLADAGDIDELIRLLPRVVRAVRSDRFRYVTEPAWDYLLSHAEFAQFRDCFDECAGELGREVDDSELVFYIHVLRRAVWKADSQWTQNLAGIVDDHFHDLTRWSQQEFELVSYLIEYQQHREAFVQRGPCCQRIDTAIRDWCLLSETEGDHSVLDCHYFLSARGQQILQEFPNPSEKLSFVVLPWTYIADDVAQRIGSQEEPGEKLVTKHARDLMIRVLRRKGRTLAPYLGNLGSLSAVALVLVTVAVSVSLTVRSLLRFFGEGRWLAAGGDTVMALLIFLAGLAAGIFWFSFCHQATDLNYAATRGELLKLLRVAPVPPSELARVIISLEGKKFGDDEKIDDTEIVADGLRGDPAMEFFSQAQMGLCAAMGEEVIEADMV